MSGKTIKTTMKPPLVHFFQKIFLQDHVQFTKFASVFSKNIFARPCTVRKFASMTTLN